MSELSGKVAIVTGGTLGIGRAAAEGLAQSGASVMVCGSNADHVEVAAGELRKLGYPVDGHVADVSVADQVERLVARTVERFGGVDILINSAGIQRYGTAVDTEEATWDRVLDVNTKAMFLIAKYAIPEMRRRGGRIDRQRLVRPGVHRAEELAGLRNEQGRDQRPHQSTRPRPRGRRDPGQRRLPGLSHVTTIGIDIGGRSHVVARCRDGNPKAERESLRVSQSRAGSRLLTPGSGDSRSR